MALGKFSGFLLVFFMADLTAKFGEYQFLSAAPLSHARVSGLGV